MNIKQQLYNQCQKFVNNRLQTIQKSILEIQESLTKETKSSAGDKHETGRAMLQLEREKVGKQFQEVEKMQKTLRKIDYSKTSNLVHIGSIVYTTQANYFIAISAGKIELNNEEFYAISPNTSIGKLLISKSLGDQIVFRDQKFKIEKII